MDVVVRALLLALIVNYASPTPVSRRLTAPVVSKDKIAKVNAFVDKLLADKAGMLKEAIGKVKLPDQYFEFSKTIIVETHGFAKLTHGHLDNLHNIVRKGDCIITAPDDALNVVVDLGVDHVKGGYFIEVKFGVFEAASNLKVEIESVQMIIKGLQSFRDIHDLENPEASNILNFDLALEVQLNLGKIDIDVNIFAPFDWLINLIAERVVKSLKGDLQTMIKAAMKNYIRGITGEVFYSQQLTLI